MTTTNTPSTSGPGGSGCSAGKKMVCYYPNWAYWRQGAAKYEVGDIDANLCTHVLYSFAVLDVANLGMKAHDTWLDLDNGLKNYERFMSLRQANPKVKLIIALGGWTDSQDNKAAYKRIFGSASNRAIFTK